MATMELLFGDDADVLAEKNFQLLVLASGIGATGIALVSSILDSLIGPFGVSAAGIGLVTSAFLAPAVVMVPVAGVLADRVGRKPVLVVGLIVFGIAGAAIATTTEFRAVLGLRAIQGVGYAGTIPIVVASIGDLYEDEKESTAQGFRFAVSGGFQTVFPVLAASLVVIAWQYPFFLYALAVPVAVLAHFWLDEPREVSSVDEGHVDENPRRQIRALFDLASRRRVYTILLAKGLTVVVWVAFLTYNSVIVARLLDGTPAQAGLLAGVASFAFAGAATQAGHLTAFFDGRFYLLVVSSLGLGGGLALTAIAPGLAVALGGCLLLGAGLGILGSLYRSVVVGLAPTSLRSGLVSLMEGFSLALGVVTPVAMGGIVALTEPVVGIEPAVRTAVLVVAAIGGGGSVLCLLLARTDARDG